jgi:hypothetical protein
MTTSVPSTYGDRSGCGSVWQPVAMAALLAASLHADAGAEENRSWRINGFLSQAAFHTSDNGFSGDSDDGISTDFNEAGLNASLNLTPELRLAGQLLARNAGNFDNGSLRTDYFHADWQFFSNTDLRIGARVGRVRNAYGLYNETRDVAHTRPGITAPGVIYIEQARDLTISRDGFGLYSDIFSSAGTLAIEAGAGKARVSSRLVKEALIAQAAGVEPDDARVAMLALNWEDADGHWRFAFSQYRITSDVSVWLGAIVEGLEETVDGDFTLDTTLLSAQYSTEHWQLTAEYLRFDYDLDFDFVRRRYPGEGAYLQYTWFFSPAWQTYIRYEYGVLDRNHRNGSSMEQFCGALLDEYCNARSNGFRRDTGIGLRWDINAQWMAAAEVHYVEGAMGLAYSDNPDHTAIATYWTLFGIEVAFRF